MGMHASCVLKNNIQYNYVTEINTVLKSINASLQWKATEMHLFMHSACVHEWILDTLTRKAGVHTKALSEILIRRRLSIMEKLVNEYNFYVGIELIKSNQNRADKLVREP